MGHEPNHLDMVCQNYDDYDDPALELESTRLQILSYISIHKVRVYYARRPLK